MRLSIRILLSAVILIILSLIFFLYHNKNDKISESSFTLKNHVNNKEKQSTLNIDVDIRENLKKTVYMLSKDIGSRGYLQADALESTVNYITSELKHYGYDVLFQPYEFEGRIYKNIYAEIRGKKTPEKILIIGAHYDTVTGTPGADDNASGIAGLLEIARLLHNQTFDKTIRFVAFTLEEPPFFRSKFMGSYVYAGVLRKIARM